ncbi:hypothetical protein A4R29_05110 [Mesorhizobium ciceri biovar biserrulae]|nr:hypothetical protein A4R29_05110 [Mesorhizobium ciceri biovar biserrulae]
MMRKQWTALDEGDAARARNTGGRSSAIDGLPRVDDRRVPNGIFWIATRLFSVGQRDRVDMVATYFSIARGGMSAAASADLDVASRKAEWRSRAYCARRGRRSISR